MRPTENKGVLDVIEILGSMLESVSEYVDSEISDQDLETNEENYQIF